MSELYLVTGGAGFIGSHLVETLLARGERVRVLDDFSTGRRENLTPFLPRLELVEGSLADLATCRRAMKGVDRVLHQGAIPAVPRSVSDPLATHAVNITGTLNLLVAARDEKVQRLVFASSSSVYGNSEVMPKHEGLIPAPLSPYAVQKLTGEHYLKVFCDLYGLPTVALRYFNVFGPRQDPASDYAAVIPRFVAAMQAGRQPTVFGDGQHSRDFTYVANVVHGNLLAATVPAAAGQVMNLACGDRISLLDLIAALNRILGTRIAPRFEPERSGDVKHSQADVARARQVLGFTPVATFEEGLARTVAWFTSAPATGPQARPA